jgi:hypothetical protein
MTNPSKTEQKPTHTEPIEAAFFYGETEPGWWARITWKCSTCGKRGHKLVTGTGKFAANLPIKVTCKKGHETAVKPYEN